MPLLEEVSSRLEESIAHRKKRSYDHLPLQAKSNRALIALKKIAQCVVLLCLSNKIIVFDRRQETVARS